MESGQPTASAARSPETRGWLLNLEIHRRCFPVVLFDLILEVLPFIERAQSSALDRGDVDEHIFAACLRLDKSVALRRIAYRRSCRRHYREANCRACTRPASAIPIFCVRPR